MNTWLLLKTVFVFLSAFLPFSSSILFSRFLFLFFRFSSHVSCLICLDLFYFFSLGLLFFPPLFFFYYSFSIYVSLSFFSFSLLYFSFSFPFSFRHTFIFYSLTLSALLSHLLFLVLFDYLIIFSSHFARLLKVNRRVKE